MAKRPHDPFRRSDLFVVRLWRAASAGPADDSAPEVGLAGWQGKIQRAISGEAHYFQGGNALIATLEGMLAAARPPKQTETGHDGEE